MYETGVELKAAVQHYLVEPNAITMREVALMRAYVVQWIDSPAWDANPNASTESIVMLDALRRQARRIAGTADLQKWIHDALAEGIDPL